MNVVPTLEAAREQWREEAIEEQLRGIPTAELKRSLLVIRAKFVADPDVAEGVRRVGRTAGLSASELEQLESEAMSSNAHENERRSILQRLRSSAAAKDRVHYAGALRELRRLDAEEAKRIGEKFESRRCLDPRRVEELDRRIEDLLAHDEDTTA